MEQMEQKLKVTLVSHTHWDREWLRPWAIFRMNLVAMMDEMIETLELGGGYEYFHFDGQTAVLHDYLEIRPEMRPRLQELISGGRLIVGPWYVMPDECLPCGESLVRNLLLGHVVAEQFGGKAMASGYVTDIFGHTSQLPQILRGFGIDSAVLSRGVGDFLGSEFIWEGPDGSRVLALKRDEERLYSDFYFAVRWPFDGRDFVEGEIIERFGRHVEFLSERAASGMLLMLDGVDNIDVEPRLPWMLDILRKAYPDIEIVHGRLEDYTASLASVFQLHTPHSTLHTLRGELREPGKSGMNNLVLANVLSSRIHLKQYNVDCENLLVRKAEPFGVFASAFGLPYPAGFLRESWRYLLLNHPHDSIGGCSMSEVHEDMMYRFNQCFRIADGIFRQNLNSFTRRLDVSGLDGTQACVLYNFSSSPLERTEIFEVSLPSPTGHTDTFALYDADHNLIPCQIIDCRRNVSSMQTGKSVIPYVTTSDLYTVAAKVSLPPYGYMAYGAAVDLPEYTEPGRYELLRQAKPRRLAGSQISGRVIDNGVLQLHFDENGALSLTDKATGRCYVDVFRFEDTADLGEGWNYVGPRNNEQVRSEGAPAVVSIPFDGPHATQLRVRRTLMLPEVYEGGRRSDRLLPVAVDMRLTLKAGCRTVDMDLSVDNAARDHRLRMVFATGIEADHFYTLNAFDLQRRPVARRDYTEYRETVSPVVPQHGITAICAESEGFAVFSHGVHESEVSEKRGDIALTLLRCTGSEVPLRRADGGQMLGVRNYRMAVMPFGGEGELPLLAREHEIYENGLEAVCVPVAPPSGRNLPERDIPPKDCFMEYASERISVSALKQSERGDAVILRLCNPTEFADTARLGFKRDLRRVRLCDLNEQPGEGVPYAGRSVGVRLEGKQIMSLFVEF